MIVRDDVEDMDENLKRPRPKEPWVYRDQFACILADRLGNIFIYNVREMAIDLKYARGSAFL